MGYFEFVGLYFQNELVQTFVKKSVLYLVISAINSNYWTF
jgi:hypothetical protein